ncbi:MAG TPA: hypothetical protein VFU36_00905 [Jatrophihabitans sp.]|nr:hypothetical protein [Jatrophihabitans sp.]
MDPLSTRITGPECRASDSRSRGHRLRVATTVLTRAAGPVIAKAELT